MGQNQFHREVIPRKNRQDKIKDKGNSKPAQCHLVKK